METVTKTLHVKGMACAACSANLERNISKVEGVIKAAVNLTTEKLTVEYDPEQTGVEQFTEIIDKLGFRVEQDELKDITILVEGMN